MSEFGRLLRAARLCAGKDKEGWSFGQFAKRVQWSDGALANWESGILDPPDADTVITLATALGVDPKPMLRAALAKRAKVTLSVPPERIGFATTLAVAWEGLSTTTLDKMAKVIQEAKHG
jgi:transcriptional regulator with XRE-family HTH domain